LQQLKSQQRGRTEENVTVIYKLVLPAIKLQTQICRSPSC